MDKKISFNKEDEKDLIKNDEDGNIIEQLRIFYEEKLKKQKEENEAKVKMLEKKNKENEAKLKKKNEENEAKVKMLEKKNEENESKVKMLEEKNEEKEAKLKKQKEENDIKDKKIMELNNELKLKNYLKNIELNNLNKAQYNDNKIILEKHLKKVSKKVYEESINMIIDDLGDSFNDLESVIINYMRKKKILLKIKYLKFLKKIIKSKKKI